MSRHRLLAGVLVLAGHLVGVPLAQEAAIAAPDPAAYTPLATPEPERAVDGTKVAPPFGEPPAPALPVPGVKLPDIVVGVPTLAPVGAPTPTPAPIGLPALAPGQTGPEASAPATTGPGIAGGAAASAASKPPGSCTVVGYYYAPQLHLRFPKIFYSSWEDCQQRCKIDLYCTYFGYWPDGGCHIQGPNAVLVNSTEACILSKDTSCDGRKVISGPEGCGPEYYARYPDTGKAVGQAPVPESEPPTEAYDCTEVGVYWYPAGTAMKKTIQATWQECQQLCAQTAACAHFGFWPDGGCMLQQEGASKRNATDECFHAATGAANASVCVGRRVISGPAVCAAANSNCTVMGFFYRGWANQVPAGNMRGCQLECEADVMCKKVTFWPNGTCFKHAADALLVDAQQGCMGNSSCPRLMAQSGPADCGPGSFHLYPFVMQPGLLSGPGAPPASAPVPAQVPPPASAPASPAPSEAGAEESARLVGKGGGFPWGWLFVGLTLVAAIAVGAMFAMGFFSGEEGGSRRKKKKGKHQGIAEEEELMDESQEA